MIDSINLNLEAFSHAMLSLSGSSGLYLRTEPKCLICGNILEPNTYRYYKILSVELSGLSTGENLLTLLDSWDTARVMAPSMFPDNNDVNLVWVTPKREWTGITQDHSFIHAACYEQQMSQLRDIIKPLFLTLEPQ